MSGFSQPPQCAETDYDAIAAALSQTERGRLFLAEHARRTRAADKGALLAAIGRMEATLARGGSGPDVERAHVELLEIADAIARVRGELGGSEAAGVAAAPVPLLGGALGPDDPVSAERAAAHILHAAEVVQETAWTLREAGAEDGLCDHLDRQATAIYAACSQQELARERSRKAVERLRSLEARVQAIIELWEAPRVREAPRGGPPRRDSRAPQEPVAREAVSGMDALAALDALDPVEKLRRFT